MTILKWSGGFSDYKQVMRILCGGGIVVFPTETSYGLGCDPSQKKSVERIYFIKKRDKGKKLPVIASSFLQVSRFFRMNQKERSFAKQNWPGAYTLILRRNSYESSFLPGYSEVAVRVSSSKIARSLARRLGSPIISTSANLSGMGSIYKVCDLIEQFSDNKYKPDLIIDYGNLPISPPSQIVRFVDGELVRLR